MLGPIGRDGSSMRGFRLVWRSPALRNQSPEFYATFRSLEGSKAENLK